MEAGTISGLTSEQHLNYHAAMVAAMPSVTWSAFQRDAKAVAERADASDILLERRDGPDLVLGNAERHEAVLEGLSVMSRLLAGLVKAPAFKAELVEPSVLPWLRFLSEDDRRTFAREFVETATSSADLGTLMPLVVLIHEWRNTALIHADPGLAAALHREHPGDGGLVPRPSDD
jgi:hypothetical protein